MLWHKINAGRFCTFAHRHGISIKQSPKEIFFWQDRRRRLIYPINPFFAPQHLQLSFFIVLLVVNIATKQKNNFFYYTGSPQPNEQEKKGFYPVSKIRCFLIWYVIFYIFDFFLLSTDAKITCATFPRALCQIIFEHNILPTFFFGNIFKKNA